MGNMFQNLFAAAQETNVDIVADIMAIASIVGMWKMFEKAGQDGWPAIIPFYNAYKLCEITMGNPWYWVRLVVFCIPVIGWIRGLYFLWQRSKATALAYGKPYGWTWGYMFLSGIFYCLTGFGDAQYYGPMGVGDNRTTQARQAKTVDFDVVKNEPVVTRVEEKPAVEEEDTVDFNFDEPTE